MTFKQLNTMLSEDLYKDVSVNTYNNHRRFKLTQTSVQKITMVNNVVMYLENGYCQIRSFSGLEPKSFS